MADSKQYGYYIEGNKIAIVEKDVSFDNDPNSKDYGPGANLSQYKSPLSDVTDGLQLQYTYAPTYRVNDLDDTIAISAYEESGGLLSLTVASMTAAADQWILITGSDKWNGLHQVNAAISGATTLVLKTKYNGGAVTEASTLSQDVSKLEDESFEIDLPIFLQKALIFYIKAKMFEDVGDLKTREYFHAQFLKQVEKHNNGRTSGLRIIAPGTNSII